MRAWESEGLTPPQNTKQTHSKKKRERLHASNRQLYIPFLIAAVMEGVSVLALYGVTPTALAGVAPIRMLCGFLISLPGVEAVLPLEDRDVAMERVPDIEPIGMRDAGGVEEREADDRVPLDRRLDVDGAGIEEGAWPAAGEGSGCVCDCVCVRVSVCVSDTRF